MFLICQNAATKSPLWTTRSALPPTGRSYSSRNSNGNEENVSLHSAQMALMVQQNGFQKSCPSVAEAWNRILSRYCVPYRHHCCSVPSERSPQCWMTKKRAEGHEKQSASETQVFATLIYSLDLLLPKNSDSSH